MGMVRTLSSDTPFSIKKAAVSLMQGDLVSFPTETVYGLGADALNEKAVANVYKVKARPLDHPLIVHISTIDLLDKWAKAVPSDAFKIANAFWPGPLTLILTKSEIARDFITGGQDKVGLRIPSHPKALELLTEFEKLGGLGVAAPSANRFGAVSPTTAEDVKLELGEYLTDSDLILDGGPCNIGLESTIIDFTQGMPKILRPGKISKELIQEILKSNIETNSSASKTKVSGLLDLHYSPKAKVVLTGTPKPGDGFIALANIQTPEGAIRLASPTNNDEFAHTLYAALRIADKQGLQNIYIVPAIGVGIANAINDRIFKASNSKN
jgi:L-threonylcarbamoyladenylate synthase